MLQVAKWVNSDLLKGFTVPQVAHILYFFSEPGDLVLDPMAGGGVVSAMQKKKILGVTSRYVMVLK